MKVNLLMSHPILPLAMPVSVPIFYLQFLTELDVMHGYINSTNFFLGVEPFPAPSNLLSHYQKLPGDWKAVVVSISWTSFPDVEISCRVSSFSYYGNDICWDRQNKVYANEMTS